MNDPSKDVARLILRYFATPVECWGLRASNRFWRELITAGFAAYARAYLSDVVHRPQSIYSHADVVAWLRHAEAGPMVQLTIYKQRLAQFHVQEADLLVETKNMRQLINRQRVKVDERTQQIAEQRWGVGSRKKGRDGGAMDRAWTFRKQAEAQATLLRLTDDPEHKAKAELIRKLHNHASALNSHIASFYWPGGAIGKWSGRVRLERLVEAYPQNKRDAKRVIEDAQEELQALKKRYKEAKVDLGLVQ